MNQQVGSGCALQFEAAGQASHKEHLNINGPLGLYNSYYGPLRLLEQ